MCYILKGDKKGINALFFCDHDTLVSALCFRFLLKAWKYFFDA